MPPVCRIGDMGVGRCCCHSKPPCIGMSGTVATGAPNVLAVGSPIARIGDIVIGGCGHVGIIVSGSPTVLIAGSPAARTADSFVGCFTGVLITGAPTVMIG